MPNNFFLSWSQFFFPSYPQDSSNYFRFPAWLNFLFLNAASQETSPYLWHTRWIFFLSNGTTDDSKANLIIIPTRDESRVSRKGGGEGLARFDGGQKARATERRGRERDGKHYNKSAAVWRECKIAGTDLVVYNTAGWRGGGRRHD